MVCYIGMDTSEIYFMIVWLDKLRLLISVCQKCPATRHLIDLFVVMPEHFGASAIKIRFFIQQITENT
jgi:hypothetical protein